jgi:transcriptional regulator
MYVPRHFATDDDELTALVRSVGAADFVTVGPDGTPESSLLPVLLDLGRGVAIAHMARANPQWTHIPVQGSHALAIVSAPQAYVSPTWYESKTEHGRVVPTWNYSAVHLTGVLTVHDDPAWVRGMVTALSQAHEAHRPAPWTIDDAPAAFIEGQLRAIVGIELQLESVTGKAKLSQNRSRADQAGVVAGLEAEGTSSADGVAAAMRAAAEPRGSAVSVIRARHE